MSTASKVTKNARGPKPKLKLKIGPHLQEFLKEDLKASTEPSQTSSVTAEGNLDKSPAFYGMLGEVFRADARYRYVKENSTSMAILGLGLGTFDCRALRCLLQLPKEKLIILSQALGEPSKYPAIRGYLDYEQICDRLGFGFNKLSSDEQTEICQYPSPSLARCLKMSQEHLNNQPEVDDQAESSHQLGRGDSLNNGEIENPLAASSASEDNQLFVPQN